MGKMRHFLQFPEVSTKLRLWSDLELEALLAELFTLLAELWVCHFSLKKKFLKYSITPPSYFMSFLSECLSPLTTMISSVTTDQSCLSRILYKLKSCSVCSLMSVFFGSA